MRVQSSRGALVCHAEVLRSISRRLREGREILRCAQDDRVAEHSCHAEVLRSISRPSREGRQILRFAQDDQAGASFFLNPKLRALERIRSLRSGRSSLRWRSRLVQVAISYIHTKYTANSAA